MTDYKGILVIGEVIEGNLNPISLELLGCGKMLSDKRYKGFKLTCLLLGSAVADLAQVAVSYGADTVYVIEDPQLEDYQSDLYVTAVEKMVKQLAPEIILMGQTHMGRDLAPRLAFRMQSAVSMDCIGLDIDGESGSLLQIRPVYGGAAHAIFTTETRPQMVTLRSKTMSPLEPDSSREGEIIEVPPEIDPSIISTRIIETVKEKVSGPKIEEASVVVAGGRGIGDSEGFKQLEELSELLKGAVGGTRPTIDSRWLPSTRQIGLTGKIIAPDIYIAIGLSGSSQHMAGCSGSKNIIAINRDPEANIFKEARYGVVGNWKEILPPFIEKVRELLKD